MLSGIIIGMLFGILLQRSQFCFVSGFRNIFTQKNFRFPTALCIAISIQSIGFFTLQHYELIELPNGEFSLSATVLGGFSLASVWHLPVVVVVAHGFVVVKAL